MIARDGGQEPGVGLEGGGGVAVEEVVDHRPDLAAGGVADDADHAAGAVGEPAEVGDVVAGVDGVAELRELDAAGEVADGVLDRDDGVALEPLVGLQR